MAELLKNMYNSNSLRALAVDLQTAHPSFQTEVFLATTMDKDWEQLELKERMRRVSTNMGIFLTSDYKQNLAILDQVVTKHTGFFGCIFPDFVEVYGQAETDWDASINALEHYTPYSSSEFAVRPFIMKQEERMMAQMYHWSQHENEHVRRLASEGCRPQLPWGQALTAFENNPAPVLPILQQLKTDSSLYVRKSVANNINDISKKQPELVVSLAQEWYGEHPDTNWIVKHGCRTLLKKGNRDVLAIFGYHDGAAVTISNVCQSTKSLAMGDTISFSFDIQVPETTKIRLEYGIDFVKANGKRNRKIFQLSETTLKAGEVKHYSKTHSFADLTTRKHYPGLHAIALIVNGVELESIDFELHQ